jgi:hypothetical protein
MLYNGANLLVAQQCYGTNVHVKSVAPEGRCAMNRHALVRTYEIIDDGLS